MKLYDFKKASEYFDQALEIRKELFKFDHPDIANSYSTIGGMCRLEGKYQQAQEHSGQTDQDIVDAHSSALIFWPDPVSQSISQLRPLLPS
jgi:tetratricopeptide (TPR) repeat protein